MHEAAWYNENDPFARDWIRRLVRAGLVAPGPVDGRSILAIEADLSRYAQCHFFAGIGGWSRALRLAGWPDARAVWTGSCPCQPFSQAGARRGLDDERHLWPAWFRLIAEHRPPVVLGEQVANGDGLAWLDAVSDDLEGAGYAVGAADLCAAGVGAPHRRQRLFFVALADDDGARREQRSAPWLHEAGQGGNDADRRRADGRVADGDGKRLGRRDRRRPSGDRWELVAHPPRPLRGVVYPDGDREHPRELPRDEAQHAERAEIGDHPPVAPGPARGPWDAVEWIECRDGKRRPTQPGLFPLADGVPDRVGRLRGYGNAIVPELAAALIRVVMRELAY